jgi:hypothetical protein
LISLFHETILAVKRSPEMYLSVKIVTNLEMKAVETAADFSRV